jgi:hypothetical protein
MNERIPREDPVEEIVGEVANGPFSSPRLKAVLSQFGRTAFGRSSACMEFEAFLQRIGARGETCLEIGTMHGITAIVLAQYFKRVVCVSVDREKDRGLKYEITKALGITNVTFHDVADNAEKAAVIGGLDFDFCYSDGDHARDARLDFDLVKRCGRVLFHEYWPIQPAVWNLVNSLPQHEIIRAQFDCFAYWGNKPWSD